ncbi:hypothetical protein FOL46_004611 [Perkinsus olseni]|nr:hypothetical protein FOL46_004611 [Perkinsus olseni]
MVQADAPRKCGQTGLNRHIGIYLRKNFPQGTWVSNAKVTDGDRGSVSMDYWCPEHGSVEVLGPARYYSQTRELTAGQLFKHRLIEAALGPSRLRSISYHHWTSSITPTKKDALISSLFAA